MPDPVETDLPFPLGGLDVSTAVAYQPAGTTVSGVNVRAADAATGRLRGGSRPGLTKYVPALSAAGAHLIQHLNVVVTAGGGSASPGLASYYPDPVTGIVGGAEPGNPGEPDPSTNAAYFAAGGDPNIDPADPLVRNPNRVVRYGGSGVQPTRHRYPFQPPDANLFLGTVTAGSGTTYTVRLNTGASASCTLLGADSSSSLPTGTVLSLVKINGIYYAQVGLWG